MTVKVRESQPASAAWLSLIKGSVPGLGFLFEVTGKPWTAWLGILGLGFAAIALLLGLGMQDDVGLQKNLEGVSSLHGNSNGRPTRENRKNATFLVCRVVRSFSESR